MVIRAPAHSFHHPLASRLHKLAGREILSNRCLADHVIADMPIAATGIHLEQLESGQRRSKVEAVRRELEDVFRQAAQDPHAWDGRGQICKPWVVNKLGYEPELPGLDFRSPADSKVEFILRYGLGLDTRAEMRAWIGQMYFERHMTYAEIATRLSETFIPVATMTVHRFVTGVLDIEGYGGGTRSDR